MLIFFCVIFSPALSRPPADCPKYKLLAPRPGCRYDLENAPIRADGCPGVPTVVCDLPTPTTTRTVPVSLTRCPVYPMMMAPVGCRYDWRNRRKLANGCFARPKLVCRNQSPVICPMYSLASPPQGCFYDSTNVRKLANGCAGPPKLVCSSTERPVTASTASPCLVYEQARPPPGCYYDMSTRKALGNGCYGPPKLVCPNTISPPVTPIACPMYSLVMPPEGCRYDMAQTTKLPNGCDGPPKLVCPNKDQTATECDAWALAPGPGRSCGLDFKCVDGKCVRTVEKVTAPPGCPDPPESRDIYCKYEADYSKGGRCPEYAMLCAKK